MYIIYRMFGWNEEKRLRVIKEHGVDFALIEDVFEDAFAVFIEDFAHSTDDEIRFNVVGQTAAYGLIFAAYTCEMDTIHFITARRAENWMVKEYEENRKRL